MESSSRKIRGLIWFDEAGTLDKSALGRSLPACDEEERKYIKNKLQTVHRLVSQEDQKAIDWENVSSGQVSHLLTCGSAEFILALYAAEPAKYRLEHSTTFKDLTHSLPFLHLQMDLRGKITMINSKVAVEIRYLKQYREAKRQLVQRAKLLQWAMVVDFVSIGHFCTFVGS